MSNGSGLNVVFGAGPSGSAVANALLADGAQVRMVSRSGRTVPGAEKMVADAADHAQARAAVEGAGTVYFCLNAPYTDWPRQFPPLQDAVLSAAGAEGARLVVLENLYAYGPNAPMPLHEGLPLASSGRKGATRAAMTGQLLEAHRAGRCQVVIGRASDFFGPGVTESALGLHVARPLLAGRPAMVMGSPDQPHSFTYIPDLGRNLVTLGSSDDAYGRAWHLPNPPATPVARMVEMLAEALGKPSRLRRLGPRTLAVAALFSPAIRELRETWYQFDGPWIVDDSAFRGRFPAQVTPLEQAIKQTAMSWRDQNPPIA